MNAVNALHAASPDFPGYSYSLTETFLCEKLERNCWLNECAECKDGAVFNNLYSYQSTGAAWYVWKSENNRMIKVKKEGTTDELVH